MQRSDMELLSLQQCHHAIHTAHTSAHPSSCVNTVNSACVLHCHQPTWHGCCRRPTLVALVSLEAPPEACPAQCHSVRRIHECGQPQHRHITHCSAVDTRFWYECMNMTFCVTLADAWPEEARPIPTDIVTGSSTADRASRFTSIGIVADHSWQQSESQHMSMCGCVSAQQCSNQTHLCASAASTSHTSVCLPNGLAAAHTCTHTNKRQCHQCNDQ